MNQKDLLKSYHYPKPRAGIQLLVLGSIVVSGLIALFIAAYHAFLLVAQPPQAFFAALVIEAGLIAECLAIINKPKSIPPWLGLIISYVVSGTYNFTQASQAGQGLGGWELAALAFGPLSALAVVSLAFGNELRTYQEAVTTWEKSRAAWVEAERQRLETEAKELERTRLELEVKRDIAKLEAEQEHAVKMARIEAKKSAKETRKIEPKKRISKEEKREISLNILREFPKISGAELGRKLDASDRTGQNILNELEQAGAISKNGHGWIVRG